MVASFCPTYARDGQTQNFTFLLDRETPRGTTPTQKAWLERSVTASADEHERTKIGLARETTMLL